VPREDRSPEPSGKLRSSAGYDDSIAPGFFNFGGMMLFAADYFGCAMRRLARELHQLFRFAPELSSLLREVGLEAG